jgi:hypothetical protein
MWKDLLTNNKVRVIYNQIDSISGTRVTKTVVSEWISVFFASNNHTDLLSELLSPAMKSRW